MFEKITIFLLVFMSFSPKALPFDKGTSGKSALDHGLKKDNFTGLYDKDSLLNYLSNFEHFSVPNIYPLSIVELNSQDNIEEVGNLILRKGQDTILPMPNCKDHWQVLLPNTQKKGVEVVLSKLRYHSDEFQVKNFRLIESRLELKPSDQTILKNLKQNQHYDSAYSLVFLDIDHFKRINKEKGYQEGDRLIKVFADTLKSHIRKSDYIFRYGGDEFVLFFKNTGKRSIRKIMPRLQNAVEQNNISFSAGIVSIDKEMDPRLALEISMKLCQTAKDQVAKDENAQRLIFWDFSN